ncbi:DNA phosphorothioation-dependent restriction protein DptH [Sphingobacterium multivorum]|uniref:DNA phosphorothioation-dependent restriction protein DptH n=1 Tax=Sphingobacterium multivorum TaxID=28454 RepID=UPI0028AEF0EC|nr:DNA phosphorothioation-dependent restriction protein DptH [Sphingobacterium multivorum]
MSNQLYKYIGDLIIQYFDSHQIQPGERFNYYLENTNAIDFLYDALSVHFKENCEEFKYVHPNGGQTYTTFTINIHETKLIIASATAASEDYFTMLRNKVSEQADEFLGTAILILFSGKLDSLLGGSGSLSKEGMPLHYSIFRSHLTTEINDKDSFSKTEKRILSYLLEKKSKSVVEDNSSIFDFEEIIAIVEKGTIAKRDFKSLGLFPHEELPWKTGDITKDLNDNSREFERFDNIFTNGDPKTAFDGEFSSDQINKFIKEGWADYDFNTIQQLRQKEKEKQPPIFQGIEHENLTLNPWVKTDGKTPTQQRSINIIAFNPTLESEFSISIKFDQYIKARNLKYSDKEGISVDTSGYRIIVNLRDYDYSDLFYLIEYKDPDTGKKYYIKLLLLPLSSQLLSKYEGNFSIKISKKSSFLHLSYSNTIVLNPIGDIIQEETVVNEASYTCDNNQQLLLTLDTYSAQDEVIEFTISQNNISIPIAVNFETSAPLVITGLEVWKNKRVLQKSYKFHQEQDTIKLIFNNEERTVRDEYRDNLLQEKQIIDSKSYSWELFDKNQLVPKSLNLDQDLRLKFDKLRSYFKDQNSLPSLTHMGDELIQLAQSFVHSYIDSLDSFNENIPLTENQKDLLWLGVVKEHRGEEKIKFSPIHPLNLAYQLQLNQVIKEEQVYDAILKKLSPINLVPNIGIENGKMYTPVESPHSPEWLYYNVYLNGEQAPSKDFVSDLVRDKIRDFTNNFDFLFKISKESPLKINAVNLGDCKEVLQGIFKYYKRHLDINLDIRPQDLLSIEICIYGSDKVVTKFEELAFYDNTIAVEKNLQIDLSTKNFEKDDLLNLFWDKVTFYSRKIDKNNPKYEYAHIAFYQFDISKTEISYDDMRQIKTGVSFNSLLADVSSTPTKDSYRTGFGTVDLPDTQSDLIQLTTLLNSFVRVYPNSHPYERWKALSTSIDFGVRDELNLLYQDAQWITYIDPKVDLDFFKENKDLVIIHYSDQYSNSSGYDAITVSRKTNEYEFIVKEFLEKHNVLFNPSIDCGEIINLFNAVNGEWLLKLLKQNNQFPREKLSLLSGVKVALTYLYHPDIIWIPISLEEILRVSGNVGLNKDSGLLSAKNLGIQGSMSDDLLFIGLENYKGQLLMHFYPVELKIGGSNLIKKGIEQGRRTATIIREHLRQESFLAEFYKNFFAKIVLANVKKLKIFHVWDNQNWDIVLDDYRQKLLNNDFIVSNRFDQSIGKFGVFHFGTDNFRRNISVNPEYIQFDLQETDGYNFLVKSVDELIKLFHKTETSVDKNKLFIHLFKYANEKEYTSDLLEESEIDSGLDELEKYDQDSYSGNMFKEEEVEIESSLQVNRNNLNNQEGIEILFGSNLNDHKPIIWEPNNTNKVMHTNTGIIGTMGTGKTQFTKSIISQLINNSNKNIGSSKLGILIFDYKGDYIKEDFVKNTNAIVLQPYHLPYNPLALDAEKNTKPMLPLHTANDIKETISNAFNLGNVQKQKLRDIIVEAYEEKGISKSDKSTWLNTPPTLGDVCALYLSKENNAQDSLYAAISNLSDFEIFEPNVTKTQSLYSLIEGVVVINLSGYDESIQNLIVAITLDAFYIQMQRHGHSAINGHLRELRKMILVDEADNFLSKNFASIRKILKEGREFGVGTILSTQFLSHFATGENEYSNYILTWIIHRVNEIKMKEVDSLFSLENKLIKENLITTIKGLEKHRSIVNLAGSLPILIKDSAFWELIQNQNNA